MRAVNLLPREGGQAKLGKESLPLLVGACVGLLVVALLGAMFMIKSGKVAEAQRHLDDLNRRYDALPPAPAGPSAAQQQLTGEREARLAAVTSALTNRVSWDRVLREFSLVLPDDVWLTSLTAKSPAAAGGSGGPGTQFLIEGRTYSHDGVARLLSRLQLVPDLTNVLLQSSTVAPLAGQEIVSFSIGADLQGVTPQS
jgi:Tfp pilus assembly protein PilN